ncbi:MAG TPA: Ig-like domain-containing protein [Gemmataceae bacterium]|nr:Ig-like domain-containing protein [Gemmataceae bacterium]
MPHIIRWLGTAGGTWLLAALVATVALVGPDARAAEPTRVVQVSPRDKATGVDPRAPVQIHFSNGLRLASVTAEAVRLRGPGNTPVPAKLGTDIEGDVVTVQPTKPLAARTAYTIEVTAKLIDKAGAAVAPFRSAFTTGEERAPVAPRVGFRFTKTRIDSEHGPTAIAVGPDGHVYVSTYMGVLYRLQIDPKTGLAVGKDKLLTRDGRKILGLTFDPEATATKLVAWISYDDRKAENVDSGTFSGVVSRVEIPAAGPGGAAKETQYIIGLPSGWHPLNGCTFGPDKRLYMSVGSMNRLGDDPVRPETPLSAAVLVADVRDPKFNNGRLPLNVQTTAPVNYDPQAKNAPLRVYATGFRELYRLCWHSNGSLYGGVNQNDGTGRADTPSCPGVPSLHAVFPDEDLVRIVEGGYYGHPNPSRKQYVLMGGNPTAGIDPWEVPEYPVGVKPDPNFNPANLIFNLKSIDGTSANGCCEYKLAGPLNGRLLICFYEGTHTLHTFAFNAKGTVVTDHRPILGEDNESLKFIQPLDVAVHPSGRICVADFGEWKSFGKGGAIWVLDAVDQVGVSGVRAGKRVWFPAQDVPEGVKATIAFLESCHSFSDGHAVADLQKALQGDHVRFVFAKPITVTVLDKKLEVTELVLTHPLNTGVFWVRAGNNVMCCSKYEYEKQKRFEAWRDAAQAIHGD